MLKIRAVKIEVNTSQGLFGAEYNFDNGLNIIRGNNSTGKSTLFQSIIYGLGLEELLGGKNDKTMQSVLKDQIEYPDKRYQNVLQSFVFLEIENQGIVTIKRSVKSEIRKPQLIDVFDGPLLTGESKTLSSRPMYVHDKGGASDETYGFHVFLAEFLNWDLPEVINGKGDISHLYFQQIAPAFIIEQKTGWSDFFATMPYYSLRNAESRVVEFLLNLDVFENAKKKREYLSQRQEITTEWRGLHNSITRLAQKSGGILRGLESSPSIINDFDGIFISIDSDEESISIVDYNERQKGRLQALEAEQTSRVGQNVEQNESALQELNRNLAQLSLRYELLAPEISLDSEKLRQYKKQELLLNEDLRKNKGALKIKKLGHELPAETASNNCPTCHQSVKESLLPSDIKQTPMGIEDNVVFLDSQLKMIQVYIQGQEKVVEENMQKLERVEQNLSIVRRNIRGTKRELVSDDRMPSALEIEQKLELRKRVEFFERVTEEFIGLIAEVQQFSTEWKAILENEKKLPKNFFSTLDIDKLNHLEPAFKSLLGRLNYRSKPFEDIRISRENYLPVARKMIGAELFYNIKFDSSASDFIRCLLAYHTSILKTAVKFDTPHPGLLIFDEPKQQDMAIGDFKIFLSELSALKEQQVIIFASFENSDDSFSEATRDLDFKLNRIEGKLIKPFKKEQVSES